MKQLHQNSGQFFKVQNNIFYALLAGQVFFLLTTFLINHTNGTEVQYTGGISTYVYIVFIISICGIILGKIIQQRKMNDAKTKKNLSSKLKLYNKALLYRLALLEGPCIVAIIMYIAIPHYFFLVLTLALMAFFLFLRPNKKVFIKELNLTSIEILIVDSLNSRV